VSPIFHAVVSPSRGVLLGHEIENCYKGAGCKLCRMEYTLTADSGSYQLAGYPAGLRVDPPRWLRLLKILGEGAIRTLDWIGRIILLQKIVEEVLKRFQKVGAAVRRLSERKWSVTVAGAAWRCRFRYH